MKCMMFCVYLTMLLIVGCKENSVNNPSSTFSDSVFTDIRDGKKYGLVKINTQVWMSDNLNAITYRNGDTIRYASTQQEWQDAAGKGEGAWCYYNFDPKNGVIYGKLYNWYCVKDSRGLAPTGYHVPSDAEWTVLTVFLGGEAIAGKKMKSISGWANGGNGDNSSGFNALPGGFCSNFGDFYYMAKEVYFWSSSEGNANSAWDRRLSSDKSLVFRNYYIKKAGFSVRCLKD